MVRLPTRDDLGPLPSARSGRRISTYDVSAVGRGAEALGRGVQQLGADIKGFADKQLKQAAFDTEQKLQEFEFQEEVGFYKAMRNIEPGQVDDLAENYRNGYVERAKQFFTTVPEPLKIGVEKELFKTERVLFGKALDFERAEGKRSDTNAISYTVQSNIIPRAKNAGLSEPDIGHIHTLAKQIGADSSDLLKLIGYETMGTFDPGIWGGVKKDGTGKGTFLGLIQFNPDNQKRYGVHDRQTIPEQLPAVGQYLIDRGWKPGMGLGHMYSIVLTGSLTRDGKPRWNKGDVNGTVREHVARMEKSGYGTRWGVAVAKLQDDVDKVVDAAPNLSRIEKDVERRKQYHDTAIGYLDNLPPADVVDVLSLSRDEWPEMFRMLSDKEVRERLDEGRAGAIAQGNEELSSLTTQATPENFEESVLAAEGIIRKTNKYLSPEQKKSDDEIVSGIAGFRNTAAMAIVDRQLENAPENFIPFLQANPVVANNLTTKQVEKYRQDAVKFTKDRQKRQRDERDIDIAKLNPALSAAARGDPKYIGNDREVHDTEDTLEIDEINTLISRAEAEGEPAYVLKYLRELKNTVLTRGGKTVADNLDPAVYSGLYAKMTELGIGRKRSKGVGEFVVDESAPVSEIVELQTAVLAAENRAQITASDSRALLGKIIPAYIAQVDEEEGIEWFGPKDVYDVGFGKIHQLLKNEGLKDDTNLKAAMFTAFMDYAGRLMPKNISPEAAPGMQLEIAGQVERAFVSYLTGGQTYTGSPTQVILPDGRTFDLANAGAKQPHSISIGAGAIEARKFRDSEGGNHIGQFLKGTSILLGSRNPLREALEEKLPQNRKGDLGE